MVSRQKFEPETFGIQVRTVNNSRDVNSLNSATGLFNRRVICAGFKVDKMSSDQIFIRESPFSLSKYHFINDSYSVVIRY